jgi:hypothetical protein
MVPGPTEKVFAEWFEVAVPALVPAIVSADRIQTIGRRLADAGAT